jgi:SLT domain-containing protein
VLKQMQTESSGNPKAINRTDSNAQAGHPSQGLLQTIPSTFNQYHLPGDSMDITDPQANIDSAIGYAKSRYGPTLMTNGEGMGSGHGY